jgi:hypothetical protein
MNKIFIAMSLFASSLYSHGQTIKWEGKEFEILNVKASVVSLALKMF